MFTVKQKSLRFLIIGIDFYFIKIEDFGFQGGTL